MVKVNVVAWFALYADIFNMGPSQRSRSSENGRINLQVWQREETCDALLEDVLHYGCNVDRALAKAFMVRLSKSSLVLGLSSAAFSLPFAACWFFVDYKALHWIQARASHRQSGTNQLIMTATGYCTGPAAVFQFIIESLTHLSTSNYYNRVESSPVCSNPIQGSIWWYYGTRRSCEMAYFIYWLLTVEMCVQYVVVDFCWFQKNGSVATFNQGLGWRLGLPPKWSRALAVVTRWSWLHGCGRLGACKESRFWLIL